MVTFTYEEPHYLLVGKAIYEAFVAGNTKGNFISLLSDAILVLRQQGPKGLEIWIGLDPKRSFILRAINETGFDFRSEEDNVDETWTCLQRTMKALRHAKYYGKTQKGTTT